MDLSSVITLLTLYEGGTVSPTNKRPTPKDFGIELPPSLKELGLGFKKRALTGAIALTAEQATQIGGPSRTGITRPFGLD
jgi:hypothetical protein